MSVYPIPTNFTGLIAPRSFTCSIFSTTGSAVGSTKVPLQGYLGAGTVITNAQLIAPVAATSYTVSINGASPSFTGDVGSYSSATSIFTLDPTVAFVPLRQDSYLTVTATGTATTVTPSVALTYLL